MNAKITFRFLLSLVLMMAFSFLTAQSVTCPNLGGTTTSGFASSNSSFSGLTNALDGNSSTHSTLRAGSCQLLPLPSCSSGSVSQTFTFDELLMVGDVVSFLAETTGFNLLGIGTGLSFEIIGIENDNTETVLFSGSNNSLVSVVGLNNGSGTIEITANKNYKSIKLFLNHNAGLSLLSSAPRLKIYTVDLELANPDAARKLSIPSYANQCGFATLDAISVQASTRCDTSVSEGQNISVSITEGPDGALLSGTAILTTEANGSILFDNLSLDQAGEYTLAFATESGDTEEVSFTYNPFCIWEGTTNGSEYVFEPAANQSVEIPTGVTAVVDTNVSLYNLKVNSGASLQLNNNTLTVHKDIISNGGLIDASSEGATLQFNGATNQVIEANVFSNNEIWNLRKTSASKLTVNGDLLVKDIFEISDGEIDVQDANVVLSCEFLENGTRTAQLEELPSNVIVSGEITVEQCFQARRAFRFINSPVNSSASIHANWQEGATASDVNPTPGYGTHITGNGFQSTTQTLNEDNNGFDWNPSGNPSMFEWNVASQSWGAIGNTDETSLNVGKAYRMMLRGDRSINVALNASAPQPTKLRSKGNIGRGEIDFSNELPTSEGHYFLLANPYQAVIDLQAVFADVSTSNISSTVWFWDPWMGGAEAVPGQPGGRGAWISYDVMESTSNNMSSDFDGKLQPFQSVFIRTESNGPASLVIKESHKLTEASQVQTFEENEQLDLYVQLFTQASYDANSTSSDGILIRFTHDGFNGLDHRDGPKMDNLDENLARQFANQLLSIENREYPVVGENLALFVNQYTTANYVFKVDVPSFNGVKLVLRDNYLNTTTDLEQGTNIVQFSINQSVPASTAFNRFSLRFEDIPLSTNDIEKNQIAVYPNPVTHNFFYLDLGREALQTKLSAVQLYTQEGSLVFNHQPEVLENKYKIDTSSLSRGLYILKATQDNGQTFTTKVLVQ